MDKTTKDIPEVPKLTTEQKQFWLTHWLAGSFAAEKAARWASIMSMITQLQVNDIGFDIHISNAVPNVSGGVTTSATGGPMFFHDMGDLEAILEMILSDLRQEAYEKRD
jgi:hypothetical protein